VGSIALLRSSAFELRLSLSPLEAVPAAFTPAGHGIMVIKNDCPTAK